VYLELNSMKKTMLIVALLGRVLTAKSGPLKDNTRGSAMKRWILCIGAMVLAGGVFAQDKSSHTLHYVTVDRNVRLEVLDWGGSGRPIVMLAGLGETVHAFDDVAPKLTGAYHGADSAHQALRSPAIQPIGWVMTCWK
jgi:hypothetical protein